MDSAAPRDKGRFEGFERARQIQFQSRGCPPTPGSMRPRATARRLPGERIEHDSAITQGG